MPATSACFSKEFLQRPLTEQTRQARQEVRAINQSLFKYDVYDPYLYFNNLYGCICEEIQNGHHSPILAVTIATFLTAVALF